MLKFRTMQVGALLVMALIASVAVGAAQYQTTSPKPAASNQWQLLAERSADMLTEHDTIVLQPPYENFRSLKFAATDAAVHLKYMLVTYDNGIVERIEMNDRVDRDAQSQAFKLPNVGQKSLNRIEVWYDTVGFGHGRAKVSIFGMK